MTRSRTRLANVALTVLLGFWATVELHGYAFARGAADHDQSCTEHRSSAKD